MRFSFALWFGQRTFPSLSHRRRSYAFRQLAKLAYRAAAFFVRRGDALAVRAHRELVLGLACGEPSRKWGK